MRSELISYPSEVVTTFVRLCASGELGSNALEVLVHRLRRKLQEADAALQIHTLRGVGYLLADRPP